MMIKIGDWEHVSSEDDPWPTWMDGLKLNISSPDPDFKWFGDEDMLPSNWYSGRAAEIALARLRARRVMDGG